jgi:hypothetical protein
MDKFRVNLSSGEGEEKEKRKGVRRVGEEGEVRERGGEAKAYGVGCPKG